MRRTVSSPLIIATLILTSHLIVYAKGPGTTAASFLKIGVGARAAGMGDAFTALALDGTSLYWNPAGLTHLKTKEISATYNSWFEEIKQGYVSLVLPSSRGGVGLGINYVDMGGLEGRDALGNPTGTFQAEDTHIFLGYARKLKRSSWGMTVGWLQDVIKHDKKGTFLANVGFLHPVSERFSLGLAAQNIGGKLGSDPLPLTFKVGLARKLKALTLALDIAKPQDNDIYFSLGAERWLKDKLALRVGYKTNQDVGDGWSAGFGLELRKTYLDYAYVPYGDLGNTHRISLRVRV